MISVLIPTFNPDNGRLNRALNGLKKQTLPAHLWELIIIDNNSTNQFADKIDLSFQPNNQIVSESKQGLTHARLKGFSVAKGNIVVLVDDDNVLDDDYLRQTRQAFDHNPKLAAVGGKIKPEFAITPPAWLPQFYNLLAIVDHGDAEIISSGTSVYPETAPVGAGMAIRKTALGSYITKILSSKDPITDRTSGSLSSGGDNDMILTMLNEGWQVGYLPALQLTHLIPANRMQRDYLGRLNKSSNASWIRVLDGHHINPWPKIAPYTLPLRIIKAWFGYKAWQGPENYIKWQGACGLFTALAQKQG
jgi:glycosyltransferase involved in cell wall biosynthesis